MPTLSDITTILQLPPVSNSAIAITGVNTLTQASATEISFLGSDAYLDDFAKTRAAAVLVHRKVKLPANPAVPVLIVEDADLAIGKLLEFFAPPVPTPPAGIDASASVSRDAWVDPTASVGPNVVIGARSRIGAKTVLHANVFIGEDVSVGADCQLFPNVVVRERITIGNRVIIHAGSVLGSDGFGYRWDGEKHAKILQIGTVIIEDDVELGSCVCVDRAKFSATRVGRGSKIDNLVQIAHNADIGPHCIMAGQSGLAGSVTLGAGVVMGGQCAIRDHTMIGPAAMIAACAGVAGNVDAKTVVSGIPAIPHRQTLREQAALRRLPDLITQVRKLREELDALKGK
ncbi:MAG TPA: UDP-3-O-(3-hydroxymyristoyl)glucosamine N-acyltransferase [Tepidisphaeraceae bacterium]|jgi:UDP-3-O-[3-hydroxymyristoyl] glucosamine N-acyltransferase|nr:UDP-3-O-(3-hydroxymyristoyl)glucosamine N-acyltransferase [Tepidisphaeraceae bacterium]